MPAQFALRLLGGVGMRDAGRDTDVPLSQPRILAMLGYLACAPNGRRRDEMVALLWPDTPERRARHSFNQLLYLVRQELGGAAILSRGTTGLLLHPEVVESDVGRFREAVQAEEFGAAVGLYAGPLMAGFHLPDSSVEFERWLEEERERLRLQAVDAAWRVSEDAAGDGRWQDAVVWLRRAQTLAPYDEAIAWRIVELLESGGNRAAAILAYESFARRLAADLELTPSDELRAFAERLTENATVPVALYVDTVRTRRPATADVTEGAVGDPVDDRGLRRRDRRGRPLAMSAGMVALAVVATFTAVLRSGPDPAPSLQIEAALVLDERAAAAAPAVRPLVESAQSRMRQVLEAEVEVDLVGPDADARSVPRIGISAEQRGDSVRIDWTLTRGRSVLGAATGTVRLGDEPGSVLTELEERVLGLLAMRRHPRIHAWLARGATPPRIGAQRSYEQSVEAHIRFDESGRIQLLRAAARDTLFASPVLDLADIWSSTGAHEEADSMLGLLSTRAYRLDAADRHFARAMRLRLEPWSGSEYAAVQAAAAEAPERYAFPFAQQAIDHGDYRFAAEALEALDTATVVARNYAQVLSWALHGSGRFEDELAHALSQPAGAGQWRLMRDALAALGRTAALDSLFRILDAEGNGASQAAAWRLWAGRELLAHGHDERLAQPYFEEAVELWEFLHREQPMVRSPASQAYYFADRLDSARVVYRRCIDRSLASAVGEAPDYLVGFANNMLTETGGRVNPDCLVGLALVAAREGNVEEARALTEDLVRTIGTDARYDESLVHRARVAAMLGDDEDAILLLRQALARGVRHAELRIHAFEFRHLLDHPDFVRLLKGGFL